MSTDLDLDPDVTPTDLEDSGKLTHVVRGLPGQDTSAMVRNAYANGTVLIALCGHRWIPTDDPRKYPVCKPCLAELTRLRGGG